MPVGAGDPGAPRPRSLAPRVLAGVLAVTVALAFAMVGVVGWWGPGGADPVADPSTDARPATIEATDGEGTGDPAETGDPGATPWDTAPSSAAVEPGAGTWQLPARDWEELPALEPADEHWVALQYTALDDLAPLTLTGCPEAATVSDVDEYRDVVRAQWNCVHTSWLPLYEELGWSTVEPAVEFYPGAGSKSECGYLEAPAFYCSAGDGTVYFGGDHFEMATAWDLAINEMVNHEYGHHLQKLAGTTAAKQHVVGTDDIERRSELQATCWAATMTFHNASVDFAEEEFDSWRERLDTMVVDGVHGNRESLRHWGTRGLYAETMGDCNTWRVTSDHVS